MLTLAQVVASSIQHLPLGKFDFHALLVGVILKLQMVQPPGKERKERRKSLFPHYFY